MRASDVCLFHRLGFGAQPIFCTRDRSVHGYELLARLLDDQGRINSSAQFLTEMPPDHRLRLDHMIIDRVVSGLSSPSLPLVSPATPLLVNVRLEYLAEWAPVLIRDLDGLDRSQLIFELIEPSYIGAHPDDLDAVQLLKDNGWRFMLDDMNSARDAEAVLAHGLIPLGMKIEKGIAPQDLRSIRNICCDYGVEMLIGERYDEPEEGVTHIQSFSWGEPVQLNLPAGSVFDSPGNQRSSHFIFT